MVFVFSNCTFSATNNLWPEKDHFMLRALKPSVIPIAHIAWPAGATQKTINSLSCKLCARRTDSQFPPHMTSCSRSFRADQFLICTRYNLLQMVHVSGWGQYSMHDLSHVPWIRTATQILHSTSERQYVIYRRWSTVVLRGAIVFRTHHIHKNLYITIFLLIIFGPYYCLPP